MQAVYAVQLRPSVLQTSCISSRLREATRLALAARLSGPLHLDGLQKRNARLDSRLFLEWADCVQKVHLGHSCCSTAGLVPFIQACRQLRVLEIHCSDDWLAMAQADHVIAACQDLKILKCSDWFIPTTLPPTLTAVQISIRKWSEFTDECESPSHLAEAVLYRMAALPALERLNLYMDWVPVLPAQPELMLHRLRDVRLTFGFGGNQLDLSWPRHQEYGELDLCIYVNADRVREHQCLVTELQQLTIHHLTLHMCCDVELATQRLWAALVIQTHVSVTLRYGQTLAALPQCKSRSVGIDGSGDPAAFCNILWDALINCPGRVELWSRSCQIIQLIGCPGNAPAFQQPWQLCHQEACLVAGLTAPCTSASGYLYSRNHAADLINWPREVTTTSRALGWQ